MKLLYGTGNPAKLDAMRHRLAGLGIELIGLKDLGGVKQPEIIEDGKTPLENARKKAEAYFTALSSSTEIRRRTAYSSPRYMTSGSICASSA